MIVIQDDDQRLLKLIEFFGKTELFYNTKKCVLQLIRSQVSTYNKKFLTLFWKSYQYHEANIRSFDINTILKTKNFRLLF